MHSENVKVTLPVKGMHCASCSQTIQKTLKKQPGVISCEVNYGNEKAKIEYDSKKTNIAKLSSKIEPFGYSLQEVNHSQHTMPDGSMMIDHDMKDMDPNMKGMDHSQHLGLNQSREDKLKELEKQKKKILFSI